MLGKRTPTTHGTDKPSSVTNVFLGTALLWFGWFGFNGASAIGATSRAGMAAMVTTISASAGALVWVLIDCIRTKKISGIGFCSGALAGLVGITPASGFVAPWAAIIIGVVTSALCNAACALKELMGADDVLDSFALHGVGGFVGSILTGIFAQKWIANLDGVTVIQGGAIEGNWVQLGYQLAGSLAICAYSFFGTLFILMVINRIPGMRLRASPEAEKVGLDLSEMGEVAYESHNLISTSSSLTKREKSKDDGENSV